MAEPSTVKLPELPELVIFGQPAHHCDAFIVGNREGLTALAAAIASALQDGEGACSAFPADGEGYSLRVECVADVATQPNHYVDFFQNEEIAYWRKRAFEAEAERSKLRAALSSTAGGTDA